MAQHIVLLPLNPLETAPRTVFRGRIPVPGDIVAIDLYSEVANPGGTTTVDLKINGATIFVSPANRPSIAPGNVQSAALGSALPYEVAKGQRLEITLAQVAPGGVEGLNILVTFESVNDDTSLSLTRFINDFYQGAYARYPTPEEFDATAASLSGGCTEGAYAFREAAIALGEALFTSAEYVARARSNEDYVRDLYAAYLGRAGDAGGVAFWVGGVVAFGRLAVRQAFYISVEFINTRAAITCRNSLPLGDAAYFQGRRISEGEPGDGDTWLYDGATHTWQTGAAGAGATPRARTTVAVTTVALADLAEATLNIALAKSFVLLSVETDRAARVRAYSTAAYRTADAARAIGDAPLGLHGVIIDTVTAPGSLIDNGAPLVAGASLEAVPSNNIPLSVQNRSGAASTVTVTITFIALED